jgi:regulator of sirC expression with transglutaminase-like and TPR domain
LNARAEARDILRRIGAAPDDAIDVAEGALALGMLARVRRPLDDYRRHLALLAGDLQDRLDKAMAADSLKARIAMLRDVMVESHGYHGDTETYDDPRNANLLEVIDRRRGLPVALGILYLHTARSLGWAMDGLNFPGHFLLRLDHGGERAIVDPFNDGQPRSAADMRDLLKATAGVAAELEPSHYAPVGNRDILLRLQNNLKLRYVSDGDTPRALEVLDGMRLFAPREAGLWRDTGLLLARIGRAQDAIEALETFMSLSAGNAQALYQAATLIRQLKTHPP